MFEELPDGGLTLFTTVHTRPSVFRWKSWRPTPATALSRAYDMVLTARN